MPAQYPGNDHVLKGSVCGDKAVRSPGVCLKNCSHAAEIPSVTSHRQQTERQSQRRLVYLPNYQSWHRAQSIGTASTNSVESDHGCTSRIYFDNVGDNMTLTLYNVTLTSRKPCLHNNKCDLNEGYIFSIKYRYSDILLKNA